MVWLRYLLTLASTAISMDASADYFYWMVSEAPGIEYDYATVKAVNKSDSSEQMLAWYDGGESIGNEIWVENSAFAAPVYSGSFDSDSVASFIIELYNYSDTEQPVGTARVEMLAAQASKSIVINSFHGGATPFGVVASPAPEPTGGVLMLLGMAVLAVRRKNMKDSN